MRAMILALFLLPLASATDRLDRDIQTAMEREHVPGLSFSVVQHGRVVREGAYGFANLEWNARVTPDTKFEIASISKMFAGAAVRILVEERRLDPDDTVSRFIPSAPESWAGMKVRHLITMSSGLPEDFATDLIPYGQDVVAPADESSMMQAFFRLKMVAPVGRRFVYSSPNYTMLGTIVANVSGMPYQQFVREKIFKSAGMTDSSFIDNSAIVARRASGYRRTDARELRHGWYLGQYLHSRPDNGILTTARDLAKWLIALAQRQIIHAPEALWEPAVSDDGLPLDYAYGWVSDTWLGHRRQEHAGGYRTGFHAFIARYPEDDVGVVVLTNCDYSAVRDYVNMIARAYIPNVLDPSAERQKTDAKPTETRRLIAAMQSIRDGHVDEASMYADALEPEGLEEVRSFLTAAGPFEYAGRATLGARPLRMHGHELVAYETLRTVIDGQPTYVTLYSDASGRVAYVELTN
jgi:CubicO group peptidase (beta-lactamase class C family)